MIKLHKLIKSSFSPRIMNIGFFYDFDLTLTEDYQQHPIFRYFFSALQAHYGLQKPEEYWTLCNKSEMGVGYMEHMIRDTPAIFARLTNERMKEEFAPLIPLSPGLPSCNPIFKHSIPFSTPFSETSDFGFVRKRISTPSFCAASISS